MLPPDEPPLPTAPPPLPPVEIVPPVPVVPPDPPVAVVPAAPPVPVVPAVPVELPPVPGLVEPPSLAHELQTKDAPRSAIADSLRDMEPPLRGRGSATHRFPLHDIQLLKPLRLTVSKP
jgi:hypothetical protein